MEAERLTRTRNVYSSSFTNSHAPYERLSDDHVTVSELIVSCNCFLVLIFYGVGFLDDESRIIILQDDSCSDDSDFDEQIMQHLVATASRARLIQRQKRQGSSGAGPSEILVYGSSGHVSGMQSTLTTSPSGGSSPIPGEPSTASIQLPIVDEEVERSTSPETDVAYRRRYQLFMTLGIKQCHQIFPQALSSSIYLLISHVNFLHDHVQNS